LTADLGSGNDDKEELCWIRLTWNVERMGMLHIEKNG